MDASHWGGHHHHDSLNLYYWQDDQEMLSDLGYLWDHPQSGMTRRAFAHNTVTVDGTEQATRDRGGEFTLFSPREPIKVMEAESQAYPQAPLYRRTVAQVEHEPGRQYVLDIFRVRGGKLHEYVFHGIHNDLEMQTPELQPLGDHRLDLTNVRSASAAASWRLTWKFNERRRFTALWTNEEGFLSMIGDGWGQRDHRNSDVGATIPYIVRRAAAAESPTVFTGVFEGHLDGESLVKTIRRLPVPEAEAANTVALVVETVFGTDYFVSSVEARPVRIETPEGLLEAEGQFAAVSVRRGQIAAVSLPEGKVLRFKGQSLREP